MSATTVAQGDLVEPAVLAERLDADHRAVLDALPADLFDLSDIVAARERVGTFVAALPRPDLPTGVVVSERSVPGFEGGPEVRVKLYRPAGLAVGSPAIYWIHGGGMVMGCADLEDARCAVWAAAVDALVVSVDYRLAPEHPYPAPLDDCYAGLCWLAGSAAELGVDPARIAVGGASAGGGLAAGLALRARDGGGPAICHQHLVCPMLDDRHQTPSSHSITDTRVWNRGANLAAWDAYLPGAAGRPDVPIYAAPSRATDLAGLPPTYLPVGSLDLFVDEDIAYAQALLQAGVAVELHVYPGAFHGSNSFVADSALSRRWVADELAAARRGVS
jgi:acetyl esterase/lipase